MKGSTFYGRSPMKHDTGKEDSHGHQGKDGKTTTHSYRPDKWSTTGQRVEVKHITGSDGVTRTEMDHIRWERDKAAADARKAEKNK